MSEMWDKTHNSELVSYNSEFFSLNFEIISQLQVIKSNSEGGGGGVTDAFLELEL